MTKIVLFFFMQCGWSEFKEFDTMAECEFVRVKVEAVEGLCLEVEIEEM